MSERAPAIVGGVDTHKDSHHAAVITVDGELLADHNFPATSTGHRELLSWMQAHGRLVSIGVEGTGSYGAALARSLTNDGETVVEVNRPNPRARRAKGKSDVLDAEQAARAVLARLATAVPKSKDGPVEAIRMLRIVRSTAVKSRTQAMNALLGVVVTSPDSFRDVLNGIHGRKLIERCLHLEPHSSLHELVTHPDQLQIAATQTALHELAVRWHQLDDQIKVLDRQLEGLVAVTAPALVELHGVGTETAGQLLITAGDNPQRLSHEAAFARLCGVAPQPASSGRTTGRHRLSRSGDRAANTAIYMIVITRLRRHPPTRAYVACRQAQGLSKREIIRCLKRYVAREIYNNLPQRLDRT